MSKCRIWIWINRTFKTYQRYLLQQQPQEEFIKTHQVKFQQRLSASLEAQLTCKQHWLQGWLQWQWPMEDRNKFQYTAAYTESNWTSSASIAVKAFALTAWTQFISSTDLISYNHSWWTTSKILISSKARLGNCISSAKTSMTSLTGTSRPRSDTKCSTWRSRVPRPLKMPAHGFCSWSTKARWATLRKRWKSIKTSWTTKSSISSREFNRQLKMASKLSNQVWRMQWRNSN